MTKLNSQLMQLRILKLLNNELEGKSLFRNDCCLPVDEVFM